MTQDYEKPLRNDLLSKLYKAFQLLKSVFLIFHFYMFIRLDGQVFVISTSIAVFANNFDLV